MPGRLLARSFRATAVRKALLGDSDGIVTRLKQRSYKSSLLICRQVREKLVSRFLISTFAPGTTAPFASTTVPWIVPVVI